MTLAKGPAVGGGYIPMKLFFLDEHERLLTIIILYRARVASTSCNLHVCSDYTLCCSCSVLIDNDPPKIKNDC